MNLDNYDPAWEEQYDSEYDSTWEDDEPPEKKKTKTTYHKYKSRNRTPMMDMQNYRHGYRNKVHYYAVNEDYMPNLLFYQNQIPFQPAGVKIEELLHEWKEDYKRLEYNHSFIQWLFPLQEPGVNQCASPLTLKEIQMMKEDKDVMRRFLESYKLMLGFYGIILQDDKTGKVICAENCRERFENLNNHSHNNLRITRILKCLGELGYNNFQAPLVRFFLKVTLCHNQLRNVKRSALDYFMFTVKDRETRKEVVHFAWENYEPQEEFIWGPADKLRQFKPVEEKKITENETTENLNEQGDNGKHKNNDLVNCESQIKGEKSRKENETEDVHQTEIAFQCKGSKGSENSKNTERQNILRNNFDSEEVPHGGTAQHHLEVKHEISDNDIAPEYKNEENKDKNRANKYMGKEDRKAEREIKSEVSAPSQTKIVQGDKGTKSMGSETHVLMPVQAEDKDDSYCDGCWCWLCACSNDCDFSSSRTESRAAIDIEDKKCDEIENENSAKKSVQNLHESKEKKKSCWSYLWSIVSLESFCCPSCFVFTNCCNFSTDRSVGTSTYI